MQGFEVDDVVRFQDEECLFKIKQFRSNHIILNCLHDDFKSFGLKQNETETANNDDDDANVDAEFVVSLDQLKFISFVSKSVTLSCMRRLRIKLNIFCSK